MSDAAHICCGPRYIATRIKSVVDHTVFRFPSLNPVEFTAFLHGLRSGPANNTRYGVIYDDHNVIRYSYERINYLIVDNYYQRN